MIASLRETGVQVIEVILGTSYFQRDAQTYVISNDEVHYSKLLQELPVGSDLRIVHTVTLANDPIAANGTNEGLMSVWKLSKACAQVTACSIEVILITALANEVTGEESDLFPKMLRC